MSIDARLKDKVAIITGAAGGIGKARGILFAKQGARLALADIDAEGLKQVAGLIAQAGATAIVKRTDISDEDQVQALVATALEAYSEIRVNAVYPGLIETAMTQSIFDQARKPSEENKLGSRCELRRCGRPQEVASVILFLACDEASYVTGQALRVDGGNTASLNLPGLKV